MEDEWVYIDSYDTASSVAAAKLAAVSCEGSEGAGASASDAELVAAVGEADATSKSAAAAVTEDAAGNTTDSDDNPSVHGATAALLHARTYDNTEFYDTYYGGMYTSDEGRHGGEGHGGNGGTKSNSPKTLQSICDNYGLYDKQYGNIFINTGGRHEGTAATVSTGGRNGGAKSNSPEVLPSAHDNTEFYDTYYGGMYIGEHGDEADGSNEDTESNSPKMLPGGGHGDMAGNNGGGIRAVDGWKGHVVFVPPARRRAIDMYNAPVYAPLFMSVMPSWYLYVSTYAYTNPYVRSLCPYPYM